MKHLNDREIYERTLHIPYPYTEADADKFTAVASDAAAHHGHPVNFAIRDEAERLIGGCGFTGLVPGHRAEFGYWLAKPYWGRGIMTDVVRAACEYAEAEWQLVRIMAHVFHFNTASARVLEKRLRAGRTVAEALPQGRRVHRRAAVRARLAAHVKCAAKLGMSRRGRCP
jgi:RimJ/RimL family protein N-acetyltransferase